MLDGLPGDDEFQVPYLVVVIQLISKSKVRDKERQEERKGGWISWRQAPQTNASVR